MFVSIFFLTGSGSYGTGGGHGGGTGLGGGDGGFATGSKHKYEKLLIFFLIKLL